MINEGAFRSWLEQNGAQTESGRNVRTYAVRTIERNLSALGLPYDDLEEAFRADKFVALRARLKQMRADAWSGGQDYRILMPDSLKPMGRLASWGSWLGQYGRFLGGEAPRPSKDADLIRQYVLDHYIEPAREDGRDQVDVLVREVNVALNLNQAWPNICQALKGRIFQELAQVPPPEQIGVDQSPATTFRFDVTGRIISRPALEKLRARFLSLCPDFRNFAEPGTGWAKEEKDYKVAASERVRSALSGDPSDEALGKDISDILKSAAQDGPLVRWQTIDSLAKNASALLSGFCAVIGKLVRSAEPTATALAAANEALEALRARGAASLTYGERINILSSALSMVRPNELAPLKISRINEVWETLTGEKLFVEATSNMATDYQRLADGFAELFEIMRDDWHWDPQDWLDIQGFLWIANDKTVAPPDGSDRSADTAASPAAPMAISPVNLILYGPPGTGKTYATTEEAIRLCGEPVPSDRADVVAAYQKLLATGRIEFVTFHQSLSYEEFIEGRQPVTGSETESETSSGGFRLETVPGIFRRIAKRAETSRGPVSAGDSISVAGRQVFKMSIGEGNNPDDAHLFEAAIANNYTLLGFDDIDWSNEKFTDRKAIFEACKALGDKADDFDDRSGRVQMPHRFRNWMRKGDIVIVSKGNSLFRAIGEVTGDYEFHPRPEGDYGHRRAVRWLWVDRGGVAVSEIYNRRFMSQSIYLLYDSELNIPALERYMNSARPDALTEPEPFVLVIDEINRANISKVFGELITLLEPDKRLGRENALTVRLPYSGEEFGVPANLHILGTMNTADRSIALLDTALRRRFTFREMMPNPVVLEKAAADTGIDLPKLLETLNQRIEYLYDREHQIGHAYFSGCTTSKAVDDVMRQKVIPLLAEYFFEDWAKIAAVLGDLETHDGPISGGFLERLVLKAPPGLDDGGAPIRFRWKVRSEAAGFDYSRLVNP